MAHFSAPGPIWTLSKPKLIKANMQGSILKVSATCLVGIRAYRPVQNVWSGIFDKNRGLKPMYDGLLTRCLVAAPQKFACMYILSRPTEHINMTFSYSGLKWWKTANNQQKKSRNVTFSNISAFLARFLSFTRLN